MGARVSKSKCPSCGAISIRPAATKCPACQAWVHPPKFTKRRLRLSPVGIIGFTVGLCIVGMVSGVIAAVVAQGKRSSPRLAAPATTDDPAMPPSASAAPMDSAAGSSGAPLGTSAASPVQDPPAAEGKFVKAEQVRLDVTPTDLLFSSDSAHFFVLAEDGSLRVHDAATGAEKRRTRLPGRGKFLRALPGARVAVLGLPAEVVLVDEARFVGGGADAEVLKRVAVRDVVDLVAVGEPARVVALMGQQGRVARLSPDLSAVEAEFVSVPAVQALATLRVGELERLVMLAPTRPPLDAGSIFVCDPTVDPFGASRSGWVSMTDPRVSRAVGADRLLLFDAVAATVVDFSMASERRVAPSGPQPIAAFRWVGDRAVVIGATGSASVVSFAQREVQSTLALGDIPSAAVGTPDRRVMVVALGGLKGGRGAKTVVLGGEPLAVESTVQTGEGSHLVAMSPKGTSVVVGAVVGKAVTLLVRK